jgi:hypothetical protein
MKSLFQYYRMMECQVSNSNQAQYNHKSGAIQAQFILIDQEIWLEYISLYISVFQYESPFTVCKYIWSIRI